MLISKTCHLLWTKCQTFACSGKSLNLLLFIVQHKRRRFNFEEHKWLFITNLYQQIGNWLSEGNNPLSSIKKCISCCIPDQLLTRQAFWACWEAEGLKGRIRKAATARRLTVQDSSSDRSARWPNMFTFCHAGFEKAQHPHTLRAGESRTARLKGGPRLPPLRDQRGDSSSSPPPQR